jgi:hypothetical protein
MSEYELCERLCASTNSALLIKFTNDSDKDLSVPHVREFCRPAPGMIET